LIKAEINNLVLIGPITTTNIINDKGKNEIGMITSGGYSPSLERPISMGYLNHNKFNVDEPIFGEVRNKFFSVTLTKLPFVPTSFKRN